MAINQCRNFFSNYPTIQLVEATDTASSMKNVSDNKLKHTGAIGSKLAAKYYDLEIIGESIETDKKNFTRFFVLQKETPEDVIVNKASLQMVLKNNTGSLANTLQV